MSLTNAHTGEVIAMYMEENGVTIDDVQNKSKVSARTIYRILKGETKLNAKVAIALEELIPGLSAEFLLSYDSKFQLTKTKFQKENNIKDLTTILDKFKIKKLYPKIKDEIELFNIAKNIFGLENLQNGDVMLNSNIKSFNFSIANNNEEDSTIAWLNTAMSEYLSKNELLSFNENEFDRLFERIKSLSNTNTKELTEYNMISICKKSGINYYNRDSIPNSRIRGVCIVDRDGHYYIFTSNLFKCIENRWLHFVHECIHIKNKDFEKVDYDVKENENKVHMDAIQYFVGDKADNIKTATCIDDLSLVSKESKAPIGIVVEIYRSLTGDYKNYSEYLHRYK